MGENYILPPESLEQIEGTALYYPCSGKDYAVPIGLFSPWIADFWFVDLGYFRRQSAKRVISVLAGDAGYQLISVDIDGPPVWGNDPDVTPCIRTETYIHRASGKTVRVHRRRGYGFYAAKNETRIGKVGVFFYRGDSQGEGGSGNKWLSDKRMEEIMWRMIDGGLVVTDGSQRYGDTFRPMDEHYSWSPNDGRLISHPIPCNGQIALPADQPADSPEAALIRSAQAFKDKKGREYTCVGYAGMRYGPTLAWRVKLPAEHPAA